MTVRGQERGRSPIPSTPRRLTTDPCNRLTRRTILAAAPSALALASGLPAFAQKKYDAGVTDSEIKLGHTAFYTGPASSYGTIGKAMAAYYRMVNDQGGVNGRKI